MSIETTYLGLNSNDIAFLSMLGTWLASLGTLAAVITSLYLARASNKVKLNIISNLAILVGYLREYENDDRIINIEITNNGNKPVTIQNIGWKISKDRFLIIPLNPNPFATPLPKTISYGESVRWVIEVTAVKNLWIPDLIENGVKKEDIRKWRLIVSLTTGEQIKVKLNPTIINLIEDYLPK